MRGIFPNEKQLVIELHAGEPKEVPDYVAKYYVKNYPHVYRYTNQPKPEEVIIPKEKEKEIKFDPVGFLELNYQRVEEALKALDRKEVLLVGKSLNLTGIYNQATQRVIDRIVQDIEMRNKQAEELAKHKEAGE
jgi:hypothetical protein